MKFFKPLILVGLSISMLAGGLLLFVLMFFTLLSGMDMVMVLASAVGLGAYIFMAIVARRLKTESDGPWLLVATIITAITVISLAFFVPPGWVNTLVSPFRFMWTRQP